MRGPVQAWRYHRPSVFVSSHQPGGADAYWNLCTRTRLRTSCRARWLARLWLRWCAARHKVWWQKGPLTCSARFGRFYDYHCLRCGSHQQLPKHVVLATPLGRRWMP